MTTHLRNKNMPTKTKLPEGFIYPPCQVCGLPTPTHTKNGLKLTHKRRLDMKTCGSGDCFGVLVAARRIENKQYSNKKRAKVILPVVLNLSDIAYNKFLYAGKV